MTDDIHRKIVLNAYPDGMPKPSDWRIEEGPVPELGQNEILIKTMYIGLEPRLRPRLRPRL